MGTGVELCYELRGTPPDPVVVLIAGLGRQLIGWDDAFCDLLVARGFRVLRFDNRDAGLSTHLDGGPAFDIAAARVARRDAMPWPTRSTTWPTTRPTCSMPSAVEHAHLVGTSMGGMIAQTIAIRHPSRVRSLCSIMSTTGADDVARPTPEAMAVVTRRPPTDQSGYVDFELTNCRVVGSRAGLVDEAWRRARFEHFFDRGIDPAGTARQIMAIVASGDRTGALGSVTVPTLVIHGDADTLVPLDGGEATARAVPGAELLVIRDMGHEIPPAAQPEVLDAIVANARRAERATHRDKGAAR